MLLPKTDRESRVTDDVLTSVLAVFGLCEKASRVLFRFKIIHCLPYIHISFFLKVTNLLPADPYFLKIRSFLCDQAQVLIATVMSHVYYL